MEILFGIIMLIGVPLFFAIWIGFFVFMIVRSGKQIKTEYEMKVITETPEKHPLYSRCNLDVNGVIKKIVMDIRDNNTTYYPEVVFYINDLECTHLLSQPIPLKKAYRGYRYCRKHHLLFQENDKIDLKVNQFNLNELYCPSFLNPDDSEFAFDETIDKSEKTLSHGKKIFYKIIAILFILYFFLAPFIAPFIFQIISIIF